MKIVHMVLVGPFTEGMTYQENILPQCHRQLGHEVTIIANCMYWNKGKIENTEPKIELIENGIKLIRLPFIKIGNAYITEKLRIIHNLDKIILQEAPNFIYLHDFCTFGVYQIRKYIEKHSNTVLVIDSHVSYTNSGKNWLSLHILHGTIYRHLGRVIYKYARNIYFIGNEEGQFLKEIYHFPPEKLAYLPLGGMILPEKEYERIRKETREHYSIPSAKSIFVHSGKIDPPKKTIELIQAFIQRDNKENGELYIIGDTENSNHKEKIVKLCAEDSHIHFMGWMSGKDLSAFLCAADIYIQPGTPSATLQIATCNRCGVVVSYEGYKSIFSDEIYYTPDDKTLCDVINKLCDDQVLVKQLRKRCFSIAQNMLDYEKQAARVLGM